MPAPKTYSNLVRYDKAKVQESNDDEGKWTIDFIAFGFVFFAFASGLQLMVTNQSDIVAASTPIYQLVMLVSGLIIGTTVAMVGGRTGVKVGFPTQASMVKFLMYTTIFFIGLLILNGIIGKLFSGMSVIDYILPQSGVSDVGLTVFIAAVVEELVYSLAFGILLFRVITYGATGLGGMGVIQQYFALFIAAIMNGLLFWWIHFHVYGLDIGIGSMLVINRIIYTFLFYLTRDLKFPMMLHILHNMLALSSM